MVPRGELATTADPAAHTWYTLLAYSPRGVVDLMLLQEGNPRSLLTCATTAHNVLQTLSGRAFVLCLCRQQRLDGLHHQVVHAPVQVHAVVVLEFQHHGAAREAQQHR